MPCKFPIFICHSHWSPCFERTTICNISVFICLNACQQIFIHNDICCQNCISTQILRGSVCECSVYKPGKPVKLPRVSDFVGFILRAIAIHIILIGCKYCRLVCTTAAIGAEAIFIISMCSCCFYFQICYFCVQIGGFYATVLSSAILYIWSACIAFRVFFCFYSRCPIYGCILTDCHHCFFRIYICHIYRGKYQHCCHSRCDHFSNLSADCSVFVLFRHFISFHPDLDVLSNTRLISILLCNFYCLCCASRFENLAIAAYLFL